MSKRRRGERNWEEPSDTYRIHYDLPPKAERQKPQKLSITQLQRNPPSYEVEDHRGNEWVVTMAADGQFEIIVGGEQAYHNMNRRVLKAVERYHREQFS